MSDPVALDDGDEAPRKARRSRRLERHLKRGGAEELNIVSMIDVFAVLVFFLLVNSSISATRLNVLSLNLPSADQTAPPPEDEKLQLSVTMLPDALIVSDRNGAVRRLDSTPAGYNVLALSETLVEIKKAAPSETSITLLVSPDVPYDDVVKVMDAARLTPAAAQSLGLASEMFPLISIGDAAAGSSPVPAGRSQEPHRGSRRRERRKERAQRRKIRAVAINIVSLIDIFAILVFYLLVNALVVEVIPSPRSLTLPESAIEDEPRQAVTIVVTTEEILVDNRSVMPIDAATAPDVKLLAPLQSQLLLSPLIRVQGDPENRISRGEVNIVADKSIPYSLLKKVMATCTEARFAKISLAVVEKKGDGT